MPKGKLKKVFPGGNTARGFYSFYDYIIEPDAARIFVIKGGPGVGKSTFMRKIGEEMLSRGYDTEFHLCSSDNASLDGVVFPSLRVAIIDGTAPHIVDPKNPGAVDEIIHLGDYWNEQGLKTHKKEILNLNQEIARLFRRAYKYLFAANLFLEEVRSYYKETGTLNTGSFNRAVLALVHEIFTGKPRQTDTPKIRHLFGTANTPDGTISYLDTIVNHLKKRYIINGDDGTGKTTLVRRIMEAAQMRGFDVEAYHCALDPDRIEHLVISCLDIAVVNSVEPHYYKPQSSDTVVDTMTWVVELAEENIAAERNMARQMYRRCMEEATEFLGRAKKAHDEIEAYYVPNMDFTAIEARRQKVLGEVLKLTGKIDGK